MSVKFSPTSYEDCLVLFKDKIKPIGQINKIFPKLYEPYYKQEMKKIDNDTKKSKVDITEIMKALEQYEAGGSTVEAFKKLNLSPESRKTFENMLDMASLSITTRLFVPEMSLVYLITLFEEYHRNILKLFLKKYTDYLKSGKTMTVGEVIELNDTNKIIDNFIEKEIDSIISEDVFGMNEKLNKFNLDYRNYQPEWNKITETFERRHVIIHNEGMPDNKYRIRTHYTGSPYRLQTDEEYITDRLDSFEKIAKITENHFKTKFPL